MKRGLRGTRSRFLRMSAAAGGALAFNNWSVPWVRAATSGAPSGQAAPGTVMRIAGVNRFNGDNQRGNGASIWLPHGNIARNGIGGLSEGVVVGVSGGTGGGVGGLAVGPDGSLYVSDRSNQRVRKISVGSDGTVRTGTITTVAGTGTAGFSGDGGLATRAQLNGPAGLAVAGDGTLYIADSNNRRVRKVDSNGVITTYVGNGTSNNRGDGGPAALASIRYPLYLALAPDGTLYVSDFQSNQVRRVRPNGIIEGFAGKGVGGGINNANIGKPATDALMDGVMGVAVLADGSVLVVDRNNLYVRRVSPNGLFYNFAGTNGRPVPAVQPGLPPYTLSGTQPAAGALTPSTGTSNGYQEFDPTTKPYAYNLTGAAVTAPLDRSTISGSTVLPPIQNRTTTVTTPGTGLDRPHGIAVAPDGSVYVADFNISQVRRFMPNDVVAKVYNLDTREPSVDNSGFGGALVQLNDQYGYPVYRAMTALGRNTTSSVVPITPTFATSSSTPIAGGWFSEGFSEEGANAVGAAIRMPTVVAVGPDGTLYVLDQFNQRVLMVRNPGPNAQVWRVAGVYGGLSGTPTSIELLQPRDVYGDEQGNVYVADTDASLVRQISPDRSNMVTLAGTGINGDPYGGGPATATNLKNPSGVTKGPDGSIYVADRGANLVRKITPDGMSVTVAGTGATTFGQLVQSNPEGALANAEALQAPNDVVVGPDGALYIADQYNSRVRRVTPDGKIYTVAGVGTFGYAGDGGTGPTAEMDQPASSAVGPDGAVYIADRNNCVIRRVGKDGNMSTWAGNNVAGFAGDGGDKMSASFNYPEKISFAPDGSAYIADTGNHRIRKIATDGKVSTVVGTGTAGEAGEGGPANRIQLRYPRGVHAGKDGNLYIADTDNGRILQVNGLP